MQHGSMIRTERQQGPDVWEFRWREPGPDGRRKHRRMVVGSVDEFTDELAARQAIVGLQLDINPRDARVKAGPITVSELTDHYRQRELKPDITWKTHSTKVTYEGYLRKWILPRWGSYFVTEIRAGEVDMAEIAGAGTVELCQDQKPHERHYFRQFESRPSPGSSGRRRTHHR